MILLDNISYSYHKGPEAVSRASAQITPGIHLLLGENGAGKTTLLHLMAGLLQAKSGLCDVNGYDMALRNPAALQHVFFLPDTALDGVTSESIRSFAARHSVFYPSFSSECLDDCLNEFGLTGNERLRDQSFGNRKKSAVAYAIALGTDVLLLDEPANGLDIEAKKAMQRLLARYVDENRTVIISTHTVWDLRNLIDGVAVMHRGQLLMAMNVADITRRIAFVNNPLSSQPPLYSEFNFNGSFAIIENTDGIASDIDFNLFYSALHSPAAKQILSILTTENPHLS